MRISNGAARVAGAVGCILGGLVAPTGARAQEADLDVESFAQELRSVADVWRAGWEVPGMAVVVIHREDLLFLEGFGEVRLASGVPVTPETIFELGSVSKTFTATALAMLVDDGVLRWRDPVRDHLPQFRLADPWLEREMTILDLLTHRSGIGGYDLVWLSEPNPYATLDRLRFVEPTGPFRDGFVYSNLMYGVAGELVAAASGSSWRDFLTERLFLPLGMTSSRAGLARGPKDSGAASPHVFVNGALRAIETPPIGVDAAGAVLSSARDLVSWMRYHLEAESGAVSDLRDPVLPLGLKGWRPQYPNAKHLAYGTGWFVSDFDGRVVVDHLGGIGGMVASVTLVPDEGIGIAVLTNHGQNLLPLAISHWTLDRLLEGEGSLTWNSHFQDFWHTVHRTRQAAGLAIGGDRSEGDPGLPLPAYEGYYVDQVYGATEVRLVENQLRLTIGRLEGQLNHWAHDTFQIVWEDPFVRAVFGPSFASFEQDGRGTTSRIQYTSFPGQVVRAQREEPLRGSAH
ncbi:MAG: serine hydrolase [Gemmatimonadota bacterium]